VRANNFKELTAPGLTGYAQPDSCNDGCLRLMGNPDSLFHAPGSRLLKDSPVSSSVLFSVPGTGEEFYLKRYNVRGAFFPFKYLFRVSRARRAWHTAHSMGARDIPTPEPVLYLERRRAGLLRESYFVTQAVPGSRTLEDYAATCFSGLSRSGRHTALGCLARQLRRMHDRGVRHGDLKAKNILVQTDGIKISGIRFVDLDAVKISGSLTLHDRCRDLARLNCAFLNTALVSKPQRLCFLKAYVKTEDRSMLNKMWGRINSLTEKKVRSSGRPFFYDRK